MDFSRFCLHCGGLLEKNFLFCPHCGTELMVRFTPAEIVDDSFNKLECIAAQGSLGRLENCRAALDTMEKELDDFLLKRL
ncbi:MAG: hypothetical protein LBC67_01420 [Spirochaetales bacterium]|jgi:hypothetical protein|nr:hypothetical protein [Spirochaetales bacterium]